VVKQQRKIWQHSSETKQLISFLRGQIEEYNTNAINAALVGNDEGAARSLIKVNTLKDIINYATRE
jgi:hypothetical protein